MKLPVHSVLTKRKDLIDKAYQHGQRKYICKIMAAISLHDRPRVKYFNWSSIPSLVQLLQ